MKYAPLLALLLAFPAYAQIGTTVATYGSNIPSVPKGNATGKVAAACNGKLVCQFAVWYYDYTPDPAPGQAKAFQATYSCGGGPLNTVAAVANQPNGETGYGSIATLTCGAPTPTLTPTSTPTPTPTPPVGATPWPTPDPKKLTVHIYCLTGEPGCIVGGSRMWIQSEPFMHVLIQTPVP